MEFSLELAGTEDWQRVNWIGRYFAMNVASSSARRAGRRSNAWRTATIMSARRTTGGASNGHTDLFAMGACLFESAPSVWELSPRLDFLWRRRVLLGRLTWSRLTTRSREVVRRTAIISLPSELHEILGTEGRSDLCEGYLLVAWARGLLRKSGPAALPVACALVAWARRLLRAWPVRAVLVASCWMPLAVRLREGRSVSLCCRLLRFLALSCGSTSLRVPWEARRCLRWRIPPRVRRLRVGVRRVAL